MTKQELAEKRAHDAYRASPTSVYGVYEAWRQAFTTHLLALDADIEAGADLSKYRLVEVDPFMLEARKRVAHENRASRGSVLFAEAVEAGKHDSSREVRIMLEALRRGAEMAKELGL